MNASHTKRIFTIVLAVSLFTTSPKGFAAPHEQEESTQPVCDQQRALLLVKQQADEAKTLDEPVARITVLMRAADLLWPVERERARALFGEAFELATQHFRQKGDELRQEKSILVQMPDQRFVVLTAIARRDAKWAKQLAESAAEENLREAEKLAQQQTAPKARNVGEKLVETANSLLSVDRQVAINFARLSLRQPAAYSLPMFLFELAGADRAAADQFFQEALAAYARGSMSDLYYLSVYPFALNYAVGYVSPSAYYQPPANFVASTQVQQAFLETLLARIEQSLKESGEGVQSAAAGSDYLPGLSNAYVALTTLEPLVARHQPGYATRFASLKTSVGAALNAEQQAQAASYLQQQRENERGNSFEQRVEQVEKESNADRRDFLIAQIVLYASEAENLERVESLLAKVSDAKVQRQLRNWLYFKRAQQATREALFDEATRFAGKVEELDHRAYLLFQNASEMIKRLNDKPRAHELLDGVAASAMKAPDTFEKARTLFGVAHLFAKLDYLRALEVMADAVKVVNRLDQPDFSSSTIMRSIEGHGFGVFAAYHMPGINLENALRELGAADFEGALLLAKNLEDKHLRATSILALASPCLERAQKPDAPVKPRPKQKAKPE